VKSLKVGPGLEEDVVIGPLINRDAVEKVDELLEDSKQKGAQITTGGRQHQLGGLFYEPTVIAEASDSMNCAKEEIFGPVAPVYRFESEDEVIRRSNDTNLGLAAYFYARDIGRIWRVSENLEYGIVGINTGMISTAVAPFGGVKQSGIGREGSKYGIEEYLEIKFLCLSGIDS
jgi:succinate-semialdehyde dehydrogenase/glutarate-semialdehyde dehydrogenase